MSQVSTAEQPRPTTSLPSSYAPADVEGPLYERWVERGYFTAHPESDKPAYCIVIPPPNVTGSLHLGHAFQHTLMDALTRRRRMQGYDTLWLPGMDHAGIATQTLVERRLDDGLIYRAERIINWCPRCLTALSDIEVDHHDDEGELVSVRYGDGENPSEASIVVATTRAETMLGDTAVAVHPDDDRYRHLVGTTVQLPLTGRRIPIVADEHVDPSFGTGAV